MRKSEKETRKEKEERGGCMGAEGVRARAGRLGKGAREGGDALLERGPSSDLSPWCIDASCCPATTVCWGSRNTGWLKSRVGTAFN